MKRRKASRVSAWYLCYLRHRHLFLLLSASTRLHLHPSKPNQQHTPMPKDKAVPSSAQRKRKPEFISSATRSQTPRYQCLETHRASRCLLTDSHLPQQQQEAGITEVRAGGQEVPRRTTEVQPSDGREGGRRDTAQEEEHLRARVGRLSVVPASACSRHARTIRREHHGHGRSANAGERSDDGVHAHGATTSHGSAAGCGDDHVLARVAVSAPRATVASRRRLGGSAAQPTRTSPSRLQLSGTLPFTSTRALLC